jgi:HlyD family secretion protein
MANKKNNKLFYYLGAALILIVLVLVVGKNKGWFGGAKPIEVEFATLTTATITEVVSASGSVQPELEVKLSPEVSGEIIELNVKEGDSVQMGALLVKIRPDNFISALDRARANLNQQLANLADTKARLARSQASFKRSDLEYKRQKQLYEQKAISVADYELADANYNIAMQDLKSAEQNVSAAQYVVKSSQATVDESVENLRRTSIVAPMSGTISKLNVELGERVVGTSQMAGTELLRIANLDLMEVRVDVNENDIIKIALGDTTIIDVDSYSAMDKEFKGIVTQIANTAKDKVSSDAVTEFEVRIRILNDSYKDLTAENAGRKPFKPGMTASVEIITDRKDNILVAPLSAVTTRSAKDKTEDGDSEKEGDVETTNLADDIKEVVFVYEEGKAKKVEVKTGISDFENIEILSGLKAGQEVVKGPFIVVSKRLKDGDPITIQEKKNKDKKD